MESKKRENKNSDILLEIVAISFLAMGGIFVKSSHLLPINTGFYRVLFSLPLLLPLAYRELKTLKRKDVLILLLSGVFLAGDIGLWNMSFSYTSVANANLLTNLTPLTVVPIAYLVFKEEIPKYFPIGVAITFLGLFVLLGGKIQASSEGYFGDFLAFLASIFYGGFLLISYKLRDRIGSHAIMFVSGLGSTIALFILANFEGFQVPKTVDDFLPILGLTICLQVIGHNLLAYCQGKLNVTLSSVICLFQAVIATMYSFIIFGEMISVREILGMIIVMVGVFTVKTQFSASNTVSDRSLSDKETVGKMSIFKKIKEKFRRFISTYVNSYPTNWVKEGYAIRSAPLPHRQAILLNEIVIQIVQRDKNNKYYAYFKIVEIGKSKALLYGSSSAAFFDDQSEVLGSYRTFKEAKEELLALDKAIHRKQFVFKLNLSCS
ncbi:DMT family transporter [Enterococcus sp. AZ192]|uniref:DMT family transporter n=1 Tax=unclassified Enterococcus TaxID=2608891 RepID=UPI003D282D98